MQGDWEVQRLYQSPVPAGGGFSSQRERGWSEDSSTGGSTGTGSCEVAAAGLVEAGRTLRILLLLLLLPLSRGCSELMRKGTRH